MRLPSSQDGPPPMWDWTGPAWGWGGLGSRRRGWDHRGLKDAGLQRAPRTQAELLTKSKPSLSTCAQGSGEHLQAAWLILSPGRVDLSTLSVAGSSSGQLAPGLLPEGGICDSQVNGKVCNVGVIVTFVGQSPKTIPDGRVSSQLLVNAVAARMCI